METEQADDAGRIAMRLFKAAESRIMSAVDHDESDWIRAILRPEWEALVLSVAAPAIQDGAIERFVMQGFGGEIEETARLLESDIGTPAAILAARALRDLAPFVDPESRPFSIGLHFRGETRESAAAVAEGWNRQLAPIVHELVLDVEGYFVRSYGKETEQGQARH